MPFRVKENSYQQTKEQYLDNLINELLVLQEIQEKKISVSDEEVDKAIKELIKNNVMPPGRKIDKYKEMIKNQIAAQKLFDKEVLPGVSRPDKKEIENFYKQNKADIHISLKEQIYAKRIEEFEKKWIKELRDKASIIKTENLE